jgi:hypothetical protein
MFVSEFDYHEWYLSPHSSVSSSNFELPVSGVFALNVLWANNESPFDTSYTYEVQHKSMWNNQSVDKNNVVVGNDVLMLDGRAGEHLLIKCGTPAISPLSFQGETTLKIRLVASEKNT